MITLNVILHKLILPNKKAVHIVGILIKCNAAHRQFTISPFTSKVNIVNSFGLI